MDENNLKNLDQQISDERSRLSTDRMDISYGEIINMYKTDELIIRPEYQRLFRWNSMQKTSLIESILLGIPIPPIFVAEDENGIWELVDGLQRISTIISFFGELKENLTTSDTINQNTDDDIEDELININKWTLDAGTLVADLEGYNIDTLPKKYAINIKRAVCRIEILRGDSNTAMKYELFKRLNSGGSKLTAQEIRNAIYRGIDPKVNLLTEKLSNNETFERLTSLSDQKKHELYDQELILRFVAFYNNADKINSNTETFLDSFMEKAVSDPNFDSNLYEDLFCTVMSLLGDLNDNEVFRNARNAFVPAYYEGITIGIAQNISIYYDHNTGNKNIALLKSRIEQLKNDDRFRSYSGSASNSKNRVKKRLTRANEIFADER